MPEIHVISVLTKLRHISTLNKAIAEVMAGLHHLYTKLGVWVVIFFNVLSRTHIYIQPRGATSLNTAAVQWNQNINRT
jgi:hypothetical protein